MDLAAAGDADLRRRVDQPHHRQSPEAIPRRQPRGPFERRTVDGVEEVERNRLDPQRPQFHRHVDQISPGLPHPHDPSAAQLEAGRAARCERCHPVGVRVGRADLRIEAFARVEVVIHLVDPRSGEGLGLLGGEEAEAGTDVEVVTGLDFRHDPAHRIDLALRRTAGRDHDAERLRLPLGGESGALEELRRREEVVARDLRIGDLRLRTVPAVLRAEPALGIHEEEQLHRVAEVVVANTPRGGEHVEQFDVGRVENGQRLIRCDLPAGEDPVGKRYPETGRARGGTDRRMGAGGGSVQGGARHGNGLWGSRGRGAFGEG